MIAPGRTHSALKARMRDAISRAPELAQLTTRADDDPAIALVDAFAASLHVLGFYRERFQAEAFIGAATELSSVQGLAAQVGYAARPAISASTVLTFTLDDQPESPQRVPIRAGFKTQTIPGPEETPALFETSVDLDARPAWNSLPARRWIRVYPGKSDASVRVTETLVAARMGDVIGFVVAPGNAPDAATFELARIVSITSLALERPPRTEIAFDRALAKLDRNAACRIAVFSRRASLFGYNATRFEMLAPEVRGRILRINLANEKPDDVSMTREWKGLKTSLRAYRIDLGIPSVAGDDRIIDLDAVYSEAVIGRHVVLKTPAKEALFRIEDISEIARSDHGVSAKVTRLTLDRAVPAEYENSVRTTGVFIQTEELHLADSPYVVPQPINLGKTIELEKPCDLPPGRLVVVQGGTGDAQTAETAIVESVGEDPPTVTFVAPLTDVYDPQQLVVLGNAAPATHGETKTSTAMLRPAGAKLPIGEVIGSGDARKRNQGFALRQPGLTYLQAANAKGYAPELQVRVDDALRPRVDQLYGSAETSGAFALERAPDGRDVVRFAGRLRTADNNVSAVYRVGGGASGNLAPKRLKTPMSVVLGLREATNPVPAQGGVDPETIDAARANAASRIIALERIVSLADYAAFARAFGGVSKAQAAVLWSGQREIVHLTVAGPLGADIAPGSTLYANLLAAIQNAAPPGRPFALLAAERLRAHAGIALKTDPAFDRKSVEAAVKKAVDAGFSPDARAFASPLAKSAILACVQIVDGVIAARVDLLRSNVEVDDSDILGARGARLESGVARGAEYITLSAEDIDLTEFGA